MGSLCSCQPFAAAESSLNASALSFAGLCIFSAVQFGDDTTNTCADFGKKYFDANTSAPINYDCGLIRAVFAFCIINM